MSISHERVTARRLVSLGNQQKVNFTQRISSKVLISGQERWKILISCKRVAARMLVLHGNQQKVNFTQHVN